ncbi:hypothetical protein RvY_02379 [Ramazzottius varieornatus]|uniref:Rho-GAP domain-containing protein n=1 Tax=Ramazzottius varieornatus TaxID=947166 RepID=A0A1D1UMV4_RAMVA|nr:hypothetical protein RvY_02379 [Ramazzottius varieornatus]
MADDTALVMDFQHMSTTYHNLTSHFHSMDLITSSKGFGGDRVINSSMKNEVHCSGKYFQPQRYHRRPNSFDSLNSSSSDYDTKDWNIMDSKKSLDSLNTSPDYPRKDGGHEGVGGSESLRDSPDCDEELLYDREDDDEKDEAVSVTTQQELEWFKLAGLDSLLANILDSSASIEETSRNAQIRQTLTKSQTDTIKRRLAQLQNSMSKTAGQKLQLEGPTRSSTSTDDDNILETSQRKGSFSLSVQQNGRKSARTSPNSWRDVRDIFGGVTERRSSSSSTESHDGKSSTLFDTVDASNVGSSLRAKPHPRPAARQAYCLTQPAITPKKAKGPPHRWLAPLVGQDAADVVGQDADTGVRILKINYKSDYDSLAEQEPPPPMPVWPKSPTIQVNSRKVSDTPFTEDIQLEFAYRMHPAGSAAPDWPNMVVKKIPSGICHVDDLLWDGDERSVKQLALLELTRIFDERNLTIQKRRLKPKKKIKNSPDMGVFGSSLERLVVLDNNRRGSDVLMNNSRNLVDNVPIVFQQMLSYLEECGGIYEEGVLRICGETNRMRRLRAELDAFYSPGIPVLHSDDPYTPTDETQWFRRIFQSVSVHDIACMAKQFLRELPQPLLTNELVDAFAQVADISDRLTQIEALNLLVLQLPSAECATLMALLRMLKKIVDAEKTNKMSSSNVAMIITPNLFHPAVASSSPSQPRPPRNLPFVSSDRSSTSDSRKENTDEASKQFNLMGKLSEVTRTMIVYWDLLFTVPPSFLRQVRLATAAVQRSDSFKAAKKEKRIRRLDPRRIKASKPKPDTSSLKLPDTESKFFQQSFPPGDSTQVIRVRLGRRYSLEVDQQHHHKVSTAIQITPALTAGDVVSKFCTSASSSLTSSPEVSTSSDVLNLSGSSGVSCSDKSSSSSHEDLLTIDGVTKGFQTLDVRDSTRESEPEVSLMTHFLVEQGGNIGMRKLDHSTFMIAACQENPNACWVVRYFPRAAT